MRVSQLGRFSALLVALLLAGPALGQEVHSQDFDLPESVAKDGIALSDAILFFKSFYTIF